MMPQSVSLSALESYVRHLRHAVATTTCQATVDTLQQMLRETEVRLQKRRAESEPIGVEAAVDCQRDVP